MIDQKSIKNFTNSEEFEIEARPGRRGEMGLDMPPTVMLRQQAGSMYFQFNMTIEQTRELVNALMDAADSLSEVSA